MRKRDFETILGSSFPPQLGHTQMYCENSTIDEREIFVLAIWKAN